MRFNQLQHENSKGYIVNLLQGFGYKYDETTGVREPQSNEAVRSFLENASFEDIYNEIKKSVYFKLKSELKDPNGKDFLRKKTGYDRAAVKNTIGAVPSNANGTVDFQDFVKQISLVGYEGNQTNSNDDFDDFTLDQVIETTMRGFSAGLKERILSEAEKAEVNKFLQGIYQCNGFNQWFEDLDDQSQQELQKNGAAFSFYAFEKIKEDNLKKAAKLFNGDTNQAQLFLDEKVDDKLRRHLKNTGVLKTCTDFCTKLNGSADDMTVGDILSALALEGSSAQVHNFLQSRSQEQKADNAPKNQKVGNLLGNAGRKEIEKLTGNAPIVEFDGKKKQKEGKQVWRGYKPALDKISSFLQKKYDKVQSIGFTDRILRRKGLLKDEIAKKSDNESKNKLYDWESSLESEIGEQYHDAQNSGSFNVAGEFYNRTKARLLADKMKLHECTFQIQEISAREDNETSTNDSEDNSLAEKKEAEDLAKAAKEALLIEKKKIEAEMQKLNSRVAVAEDILKNKMPNAESEEFKDQAYFAELEKHITKEESQDQSANDYMVGALEIFSSVANNNSVAHDLRTETLRKMAKDMFGISDQQLSDKKFTLQEFDVLTHEFIAYQAPLLIKNLQELSQAGEQKKQQGEKPFMSHDYKITAVDANKLIKNCVELTLGNSANLNQAYEENYFHKQNLQDAEREI